MTKQAINKPSDISAECLKFGQEAKKAWLESGNQRDKGQEKALLCLAAGSDVEFHVENVGKFKLSNFQGFSNAKTGDKKAIIDTVLKTFFSADDIDLKNKTIRDRLRIPFQMIWEVYAYVTTSGGEFRKDGQSLVLFPKTLMFADTKDNKEQRRIGANSEALISAKGDVTIEGLKKVAAYYYRGPNDKKVNNLDAAYKAITAALCSGVEATINPKMSDSAFIFALMETYRFPPEVLKQARARVLKLEEKLDKEANESPLAIAA